MGGPAVDTDAVRTGAVETLATRRGEVRSLTGLRLFAAAWVVVFHFEFTPGAGFVEAVKHVRAIVGVGSLGVDLFYVLSGFVIAFTYLDRMGPKLDVRLSWRFIWARVSRVWPVFAVVTNLFGLWLLAKLTLGDGDIAFQKIQPEMSFTSWLRQMFMVQMWSQPYFDGSSWVGPAWSISAEWAAYVLFPLTALVYFRLGRLPAGVLAGLAVLTVTPIAVISGVTGNPYFPYSWLVRIGVGFTSGVLVYLAIRHIPLTDRVRRAASWATVAVLAGIVAGLFVGDSMIGMREGDGEHGGMVMVLFPVLVAALALSVGRGPARLLSTNWAVHGGRISYSLYLVHIPVFEVIWTLMIRYRFIGPDTPGGVALAFAGLVSVFVAAHLLWRFVEEPARQRMRRLTDRPRVAERAATEPTAEAAAADPRPDVHAEAATPEPTPEGSPAVDVEHLVEGLAPGGAEVGPEAVRRR
ncbi:MAG TPA: acyltransferase [Pseudonocardia sp.]|nr:acyltransferase [Pseudonocardia sp.]